MARAASRDRETADHEQDATVRRSPLAMAVLVLLTGHPQHPYGLRQRIREWQKDQVINVTQANAIYQTIGRLERHGLIEAVETAREERRPERTLYLTTDRGRQLSRRWVRELLSTPINEYPSFPAALSFASALPHDDMVAALVERLRTAERQLVAFDAATEEGLAAADRPPSLLDLADHEYRRAMAEAELTWLRGFLDRITG
ncbi:PadR family transcriptional regulator [Kribbella karoonensis]|uniref:PadR family transcriptional regulator n=1 Tax=Kribbella karoonensis TaxID=324851 RepID=A0ABP4QCK1_9ACTN